MVHSKRGQRPSDPCSFPRSYLSALGRRAGAVQRGCLIPVTSSSSRLDPLAEEAINRHPAPSSKPHPPSSQFRPHIKEQVSTCARSAKSHAIARSSLRADKQQSTKADIEPTVSSCTAGKESQITITEQERAERVMLTQQEHSAGSPKIESSDQSLEALSVPRPSTHVSFMPSVADSEEPTPPLSSEAEPLSLASNETRRPPFSSNPSTIQRQLESSANGTHQDSTRPTRVRRIESQRAANHEQTPVAAKQRTRLRSLVRKIGSDHTAQSKATIYEQFSATIKQRRIRSLGPSPVSTLASTISISQKTTSRRRSPVSKPRPMQNEGKADNSSG